jgi:putative spermidine/putrescine transport system substrate-binding protein
MTPPMQQSLGNVDDMVKKLTVVDWDTINAHRAQWDTRWNRQIER